MADSEISGRTIDNPVTPDTPNIPETPDITGTFSTPETDPATHVETLRMATREELNAAIQNADAGSVALIFLKAFEESSKISRGKARQAYEEFKRRKELKAPFAIAFSNVRRSRSFFKFEVDEDYAPRGHEDSDKWTLLSKNVVMEGKNQVPEDITKVHEAAAEIGQTTEDNKVKIVLLSLFHQYLGVDIAKLAKALECKPEEVSPLIAEINEKYLKAQEAEIHLRNNITILQPKRQWTLAMDNEESVEQLLKQDQQIADILKAIQVKVEAAKAATATTAATKPATPDTEPPKTFEDKIRSHENNFETDLDYQIALAIAYDSDNSGIGLSISEIKNYMGEEETEELLIQGRMEKVKIVLKSIGINLIKKIADGTGVYLLKPGKIELPQATPLLRHQAPRQPPRPAAPAEKPKTPLSDMVIGNRAAFKCNNPLFEIAKQLARESERKEPGSTIEELALRHSSTYRKIAEQLTPLKEILASIGLELLRKDHKGKAEFSISASNPAPPCPALTWARPHRDTSTAPHAAPPAPSASKSIVPRQSPLSPKQPTSSAQPSPAPSAPPPHQEKATLDLSKLEGKTFKDATEANEAIIGSLKPVILSGQPMTTGSIAALRRELEAIKALQHSGLETRLQRYIDKLRRAEQNAKHGVIRDHHRNEVLTGIQ